MGKKISISQLSAAVMEAVREYADTATEEVKQAVTETGDTVRDEIRQNAPKDTGRYNTGGWLHRRILINFRCKKGAVYLSLFCAQLKSSFTMPSASLPP